MAQSRDRGREATRLGSAPHRTSVIFSPMTPDFNPQKHSNLDVENTHSNRVFCSLSRLPRESDITLFRVVQKSLPGRKKVLSVLCSIRMKNCLGGEDFGRGSKGI